ncbi:SDR family oxidoreductase [Streptomyces sp. bgisy027]|uniref:SDR family oxidoreductase n=1 Tax=unclassified Streptomyces TaxID=2593676 RepID=UPI003D70E1B8
MDLGISGKVALVTGGSKGIGHEASKLFGKAGARVVVVAREKKAIDETVDAIRDAGGEAAGFSADLTEVENYARAVEFARETFGAPEIAVFNIQAPKPGSFAALDDDDFRHAFHLVTICYANMVRAVLPGMIEKRFGRVVTLGSGTAKQPIRTTELFSYVLANSTRAGAVGLNKTLAGDYGKYGITFNTIAVGSVETDMARAWLQARADEAGVTYQDMLDRFFENNPLRRAGQPIEVASLAVFLSSVPGGYTTGETILADGGEVQALL